jgi:hypothetical protein
MRVLYCLGVRTTLHLRFPGIRKVLLKHFSRITDYREREKVDHELRDVCMSALAMFCFQDPSLLEFQKRIKAPILGTNLRNMWAIESVPSDTQMRTVMDEIDSQEFENLFTVFFRLLQRGKHLEKYRVLGKYYLCAIDGSEYFSSHHIGCPSCLQKKTKKKEGHTLQFSHQIVQAALVHPKLSQVIPLSPEQVKNTDGKEKQDCETNAAKRLLGKLKKVHPKLPFIIVADGLYSKQPMIDAIASHGMHYVLVAKPDDHKILTERVNEMRLLHEVMHLEYEDVKRRTHVYELINGIPLNGNKDTPLVNYFEYWMKDGHKVVYHNGWVTDLPLDDDCIEEMVRIGRSRWMIENEVFNTVKNHGYHIEHNYGHGVKNLSFNFFLLNMLAFFLHQIFELADRTYQWLRKNLGSKKNLWDHIRVFCHAVIFSDWEDLFLRIASEYGYS